MPEVFVKAMLFHGEEKVAVDLLLNSGARNVELAIQESLARKLKFKTTEKAEVHFGCIKMEVDIGSLKVQIENPKTGERRVSVLEAMVLPNDVLDCSLIGVIGQEKLRIAPSTPTGEVIFL